MTKKIILNDGSLPHFFISFWFLVLNVIFVDKGYVILTTLLKGAFKGLNMICYYCAGCWRWGGWRPSAKWAQVWMLLLTRGSPYPVTHHTTTRQVTWSFRKIFYSLKKILYQKYLSLDNVYRLAKCSVNQKYLPRLSKIFVCPGSRDTEEMLVTVLRAAATCVLLGPSLTLTGGDEQMR